MVGEQIDEFGLAVDDVGAYLEGGHSLEYGQQRGLVNLVERLGGFGAEEYLRGLDGVLQLLLAVDHAGNLFGKFLLQGACAGVLGLLGHECVYLLLGEYGEYLDVFLGVGVGYVQPELVELVGRRAVGVEPYVAPLGLAEFRAVGLGDERAGNGVGVVLAEHAADQLCAGGDVAPLVGAAQLKAASLLLVEVEEVVALEKLVGEFGERHPLARFARKTLLHGVLGHHVVDGQILAHVADKVEECVVLHPVVVVHEDGGVGGVAVEVEEAGQLTLDGLLVMAQCSHVEELALLALHRGVANHAGGASHQRDGLVAGALQVFEHHHPHEVADMQRVSCGVDAEICGGHPLVELFVGAGHHLVDHAAPGKFFYEVHWSVILFGVLCIFLIFRESI